MLSNASGFLRRREGEAVVVDLGNDKFLFALLGGGGGYAGTIYRQLYPNAKRWQSNVKWYRSTLLGKGPFDIPRPAYPQLVHFEDINDPISVQKVNPERLYESFGDNYRLSSITMEITNERVTYGKVEETFGWINDLDGKTLDGASSSHINAKNKVANNLHRSSFIRE